MLWRMGHGFEEVPRRPARPRTEALVTIANQQSGKSITLFHEQAEPSEVEQAVREVIPGTAK